MARLNHAADLRPGPRGPTYSAWEDAVVQNLSQRLGVDLETARTAFDTQTTAVLLSWKRRRSPCEAAEDIRRLSGSKLAKLLRLPQWTERSGKKKSALPPA